MRTLSIILLSVLFSSIEGQELTDQIQKLCRKNLDTEVLLVKLDMSELELPEFKPNDQFFVLNDTVSNTFVAYSFASSALGRYEEFDYFILYDAELKVINVKVWKYRSSHGGAIAGKAWLKQFIGYSGEEIIYGKDIQALSGATISGNSIVQDIQRAQSIVISARERGLI